MAKYEKLTHFFGEMDLNLSNSIDKIYQVAFDISEACGYLVERKDDSIKLYGRENEIFLLEFEKGKFKEVRVNGKTYTENQIPKYDGYKNGFP